MVGVEAEKKIGKRESGRLNISGSVLVMERAYAEMERNNIMRLAVIESVPTGDPPSDMLWGEE